MDETQGRIHLMMAYCAIELNDRARAVAQLERAQSFPEYAESAGKILQRLSEEEF
jgi:hypothetical protein